jgi:hypothetical protein
MNGIVIADSASAQLEKKATANARQVATNRELIVVAGVVDHDWNSILSGSTLHATEANSRGSITK